MQHRDSSYSRTEALLHLRVSSVTRLTADTVALELRLEDDAELPMFSAGSHVDIFLPNGLRRSYSLTNDPGERHRYCLAVKLEANSRGGSVFIHDRVSVGTRLEVGPPRNNFELHESAPFTVLFAGGIGVTPLISMAHYLCRLGKPFHFHYCVRSRTAAALLTELQQLRFPRGSELILHFDDENGGPINFLAAHDKAPEGTHFYCCGPAAMIAAFEARLSGLAPSRLHVEHFSNTSANVEPGSMGGFEVVLAKTGRTIAVPPGTSILDALLDEGIEVDFSCMEGFCGSCRVAVVEGTPVHHDTVLNQSERASGKAIMLCCSGSADSRLVLDM